MKGLNVDSNVLKEERELLHKQLELLAEHSKDCMPDDLAALSAQMANLYRALNDKRLQHNSY